MFDQAVSIMAMKVSGVISKELIKMTLLICNCNKYSTTLLIEIEWVLYVMYTLIYNIWKIDNIKVCLFGNLKGHIPTLEHLNI